MNPSLLAKNEVRTHLRGPLHLTAHQQAFVSEFVAGKTRRTRLVASPGIGKTIAAYYAASACLDSRSVDAILVIASHRSAAHHWTDLLRPSGLSPHPKVAEFFRGMATQFAITRTELLQEGHLRDLLDAASSRSHLIVVEDAQDADRETQDLVDRLVDLNHASRSLILFSPTTSTEPHEWDVQIDSEYFIDQSALQLEPTQVEIARLSPACGLVLPLLKEPGRLDALSWRQFEKLVAELLEADGYQVELMQGTKDGGVDVVAVRDHGPLGAFKTLWQAKKKQNSKVGLEVVRELADTRIELGASKAFVVTSTYLTRGAIARIDRDRYLLGKVDRDDLDRWIQKVLQGRHGHGH